MSLSRPVLAQNGPSKFGGEGLMLRAERTWRGRYLRVTRVTPLTFYPEWMVQVAHQGAGAPQVHGGLGRAFARNYVRRNSLEYSGLRGEGSTPGPLPPPTLSVLRFLHRRDGRNSLNKVGPF